MARFILTAALFLLLSTSSARPDVREWLFDNPGDLQGWVPNGHLTEVAVDGGVLSCRATGADPILEFSPPLDVTASQWNLVEIRLKATVGGAAELFWSGTTEGKYGGFSQDKRSMFSVVPGDWRTYRVFPFWQKERRIIKLRLDLYDAASFEIDYIRIIDLEPENIASALLSEQKADFLVPIKGVTSQSRDGAAQLRLLEQDGFALAPADIDALDRSIVSVALSTVSTKTATAVFTTDQRSGLQALAFPVIDDGKFHTYNLDMLRSSAWDGRILGIGIRPGEDTGDTVSLRSLEIAAEPQGSPELRVSWFGIEEALPRTGALLTLTARLTNIGGEIARGVKANLKLPGSARLIASAEPESGDIPWGEEVDWQWIISFDRAVAGDRAELEVTAGDAALTASCILNVSARLSEDASYVPEPKPVRGDLDVGVYYFPGWATASRWAPLQRFPERKPVLGWYQEGDPMVADWHIKWAVEHGVTFFAYDWYWSAGVRQLEHGLHEGYFNSRYHRLLPFCLLWANHNPAGTSSLEDSLAVSRHWIEHYFRRDDYYTIDGKPVVIIFSPHRVRDDLGTKGTQESFEAMREECRKAGLPGLYLIACVSRPAEAHSAAEEGYDAITAYNWPWLGRQSDELSAPYDSMIDGYRDNWNLLAAESRIPMMTPVSGGWDSRPWHGDTAVVRFGMTPEKFRRHLEDAKAFVDSNGSEVLPSVLIEAWNEWGEGSYIEPHREFGFGYLDAIRDVFAPEADQHTDLTPLDVGLTVPQVDPGTPGKTNWTFDAGPEGWGAGMGITEPEVRGGIFAFSTTGGDPAITSPQIGVPAPLHPRLRVRMRLTGKAQDTGEAHAQVCWATRSVSIGEATSVRFDVSVDGQWHEYLLDLSANRRWRDVITALRFDPVNQGGVRVEIDEISLVRREHESAK